MRELSSVGTESSSVASPAPPPRALLERLKDYGQEDVLALWDEISHEERDFLVKEIEVNSSRSILTNSIRTIRFAIRFRLILNLRIAFISEVRGLGILFCFCRV